VALGINLSVLKPWKTECSITSHPSNPNPSLNPNTNPNLGKQNVLVVLPLILLNIDQIVSLRAIETTAFIIIARIRL